MGVYGPQLASNLTALRKTENENKTIYFGEISKEKIEKTSIVFQQHLI